MPWHLHRLTLNITMAEGLLVTISIIKNCTISSRGNNLVIKNHMVLKHGSLLEAGLDSVNEFN